MFETTLLRERLENAGTLAALSARVASTQLLISDSALYVATLGKRPALVAYQVARPYQLRDRVNGRRLTPAIDLYRRDAASAMRTRASRRAVTQR